uniref:Uncharacterized protein n=1 Tax=Lutzomyia longipalpis TaxID=7200 RepID=A0A1B0CJH2_LUTLO
MKKKITEKKNIQRGRQGGLIVNPEATDVLYTVNASQEEENLRAIPRNLTAIIVGCIVPSSALWALSCTGKLNFGMSRILCCVTREASIDLIVG